MSEVVKHDAPPRANAAPGDDPYVCQRCGKYYDYLDMMGDPQCDCGSGQFWPAGSIPTMPLGIILAVGRRYREAEAALAEWAEAERSDGIGFVPMKAHDILMRRRVERGPEWPDGWEDGGNEDPADWDDPGKPQQ